MVKGEMMRVLVACEFSGIVRDAFISAGCDAISCDLLPSERLGPHYQGDVRDLLKEDFDLMVAHPPCAYLCVTGNRWFLPKYSDGFPDREQQREMAVEFFMTLVNAPIQKICLENPVGIMSRLFRKPDQYVHPYFFGEPHSKKTGLWLKNLPLLVPTKVVEPLYYTYKSGRRIGLWYAQTFYLPQSLRWQERSRTFQGFADAMATQWGKEK